ncbi:MAG: hypothetical protein WBO55_05725 [Rhizobiaceae bacterium]
MPVWMFVSFVVASGLTAAGILAEVHRLLSNESPTFRLAQGSPVSILCSVLLCMFAGPWLTLNLAWVHGWKGDAPLPLLAVAGLVSLVWSFCSGAFVIQLAALVGLLQV